MRCAKDGLRAIVAPPAPGGLTYTSESVLPILVLLLIVGIPPDFVVRHLLVPHQYAVWNVTIDIAEIAGAVWLCGAFGSMSKMPHVIEDGKVRFNLGLFGAIETDVRNVSSVTPQPGARRRALRAASRETAMLLSPGTVAVRVDFAEPVELRTYPFFGERCVSSVFVGSDRPSELLSILEREGRPVSFRCPASDPKRRDMPDC